MKQRQQVGDSRGEPKILGYVCVFGICVSTIRQSTGKRAAYSCRDIHAELCIIRKWVAPYSNDTQLIWVAPYSDDTQLKWVAPYSNDTQFSNDTQLEYGATGRRKGC